MSNTAKKGIAAENVNLFDKLLNKRDQQREDVKHALALIPGDEVPLESNRMGLYRWYLHPSIENQGNRTNLFWVQEIPPGSRSGKLKSQGGQVFIIWEGNGYSIINDVRYDWTQYDALFIPILGEGSIYQHFNPDTQKSAKIIGNEAVYIDALGVDKGCGFEVLEDSPDYKR